MTEVRDAPVGWAYNDERWDATHWHLCGVDSRPRAFEGRKVQEVYLASTVEALLSRVETEREFLAAEARRYAAFYPEASDGRNTFIIFAEMIEARAALQENTDGN